MAQDTLVRSLTKADFHAFMAREPESRFEFENGRIIEMPGGTGGHCYVGTRFVTSIARQIDEERWVVHGPDRGIDMPDAVRYPDVVVEAFPFDVAARWTGRPVLIVEVLSPDSIKRDKITKAVEYTAIATLDIYIIAEPDAPQCYVWQRNEQGNFPARAVEVAGTSGVVQVPSLQLTLSLADIYRQLLRPASA
jgi:Uma2 family endonuclease